MAGSVPEKVDALALRWAYLPAAAQQRLAYRWFDHSVRDAMAVMFDKHGHPTRAAALRQLPAIVDEDSREQARVVFDALLPSDAPVEFCAAFFSACTYFDKPVEISEACFMLLMTSRLVYGDDRLAEVVVREVAVGWPP